jgi:hypothetical protein
VYSSTIDGQSKPPNRNIEWHYGAAENGDGRGQRRVYRWIVYRWIDCFFDCGHDLLPWPPDLLA